jgi:hypothetical protein
MASSNIDPAIFEHLQAKIDEEGRIRDVNLILLSSVISIVKPDQELKAIIQQLEKQGLLAMSPCDANSRS